MLERLRELKCATQVVIYADYSKRKGAFRRGVNMLCRGVQELGSLNAVIDLMNEEKEKRSKKSDNPDDKNGNAMSEGKARRALKETQEILGFKLIQRKVNSKQSELTPEAEVLHRVYERLNKEANAYIAERYQYLIDFEIEIEKRRLQFLTDQASMDNQEEIL